MGKWIRDNWKFLPSRWFPSSPLTERCWLHSLRRIQISKVLLSCLLKATAPFLRETRQTSPQLISSSSLFLLSSSSDIFLTCFFSLSRSFFFLFLFNNDMNMRVSHTHDSHKHFEIYELRPHINRCIIMLCWNIPWKSSCILGGNGRF